MTRAASSFPPRATFVAVVILALVLVASVALPLWRPLLLAGVLTAVLARPHARLSGWLGGRRSLAALIVLVLVVALVVGPMATVAAMVVNEAVEALQSLQATFARAGIDGLYALLPDSMQGPAHTVVSKLPGSWDAVARRVASQGGAAAAFIAGALSRTSAALFDSAMMLIALFFFLVDGPALVRWTCRTSPLGSDTTARILQDLDRTASSTLISMVATAAVQGAVATLGYWIAGVPRPILFGFLTLFASFIPSVGTSIVALPIAGAMLLSGHLLAGGFLVAWGVLVTGTIDNVLKPLLARHGAELHGGVVFFAMIGGIITYGALGLLVGPLAVSLLLTLLHVGWREVSARRDVSDRSRVPPALPTEAAAHHDA